MVDLHCHSCYSFLDGASHPAELVNRAKELGYTALALTDHNGVYGSLEFAQEAHQAGLQPITGAEVTLEDEAHLTLLAETPEGYANLCRLLTLAHRTGERRFPRLPYSALPEHARGLIALSGCREGEVPRLLDLGRRSEAEAAAYRCREWFGPEGFFLEVQHNLVRGDTERCRALAALGGRTGIPLVATNNTHYHLRERHRLQDTLVAIRHGANLLEARQWRRQNSEFFLKTPEAFRARYAEYPGAVANALHIAERCKSFDLTRDLGYRFPDFINEAQDDQYRSPDDALRYLCEEALEVKYSGEHACRRDKAKEWLGKELKIVANHGLAGFFLVYRDLLQMSKQVAAELRGTGARGRFDLPPGRGRGSAVSSIICYLIGLSCVDPVKANLFQGRFLNDALNTVPDIDIDFPRDIRAELIKRVHEYYGEDHAALVCIFPTYRFRGAVREIGKALALPPGDLDRLAKLGDSYTHVREEAERLREFSSCAHQQGWAHLYELSEQLWGMPRHLSQHVGGMVISSRPLVEMVPVERSSISGRQLVQWDKDSVDTARMIKVDFLSLGMLSAVEECLELIEANGKAPVDLSRINYRNRRVYDRICRGETIGAFQIESRAQIQMLVRTLPRTLEDLAVQVAIVRPGPIVGNAVNPYIRQRERQRDWLRQNRHFKPKCDHPLLEKALAQTMGVIIFQDQVMEACKDLAGFTDSEADQLRRAMSRKRSREAMEKFRTLFMEGAMNRGVSSEMADVIFHKVTAFSEFGFPKSHAVAFALLAYQSVWLLEYHPAEFVAALLNNQPMGFYGPDTLIKDAQRRGVHFLMPDLNQSSLGCTVYGQTVQLGLRGIDGVGEARAQAILDERSAHGEFQSLMDFLRRTRLPESVAERLILVGALDGFGMNRRELLWQLGLLEAYREHSVGRLRPPAGAAEPGKPVYQGSLWLPTEQDEVALSSAGRWERMAQDYRLLGLSVDTHPLALLRPFVAAEAWKVQDLRYCENGARVTVAGLVTTRQRPGTAHGILFLLVEDETGMLNVVVKPELYEARRELYRMEPLLAVSGILERRERRLNLVAEEAWPVTELLPDAVKSAAGRRAHEALQAFTAPRPHNFH